MMDERPGSESSAGPSRRGRIDQWCDRFDEAWRAGQRPPLEAYLELAGDDPALARELLLELVMLDLEYRWRCPASDTGFASDTSRVSEAPGSAAGPAPLPERPHWEDYAQRYPLLGALDELPLDAMFTEYRARRRAGERLDPGQFAARFRRRADSLAPLLAQVEEQAVAGQVNAGMRLGKFELLELVGEGGFGRVYRARDTELGRTVAIKVPRFGASVGRSQEERFLREARTAAQLRHPHICPVYEAGREQSQAYIALGFVEGRPLHRWAEERKPTVREAAAIMARVARAVAYAHQRGIIHRDIKPANIMIEAASEEPVLTDFGLAKELTAEGGHMTRSGDVMGTPAYMSPEQAAGKHERVGRASDVYALGAVLYELVTGHRPFSGSVGEILVKVQAEPPVPIRKLAPRVPRDLETICLKALAKEPRDRYVTAAALADDLERFTAGEPIRARRESPVRRVVRRVRRSPALFLLLATLLALGGYFGWRAWREQRLEALAAAVQSRLDPDGWTEETVREFAALLARLEAQSPAQAKRVCEKLNETGHAMIHGLWDRPRVTEEDLRPIETLSRLLAQRDETAAESLQAALTRLRHRDELLCELTSPFAGISQAFDPQRVERQGDVLVCRSGTDTDRIIETRIDSEGSVRLEVEFDASWRGARELGLVLNASARPESSVEYLLQTAERNSAGGSVRTLGEALAAGQPLELIVTRGPNTLARELVWEVSDGPLRLAVQRMDRRLRGGLNGREYIVFEDVVLPESKDTRMAVGWPAGVGLTNLWAYRLNIPHRNSSLDSGDAWYRREEWARALVQYRAIASQNPAPQRDEAKYKAGLCLLRLAREEEATDEFRSVMDAPPEQSGLWPALASVQLWLLHVERRRTAEAEAVFKIASGRFRFQEFGAAVPADVRNRLHAAYWPSQGPVSFDAARNLTWLQMLREVELFLYPDRCFPRTVRSLFEAYWAAGKTDQALDLARNYFERDAQRPAGDGQHQGFSAIYEEYPWLLRIAKGPEQALDFVNLAIKGTKGISRADAAPLLVERARIRHRLGQTGDALADVRQYIGQVEAFGATSGSRLLDAYLLLGFLCESQGDMAGALDAWKAGSRLWKKVPDVPDRTVSVVIVVPGLINVALADELTLADANFFFQWAASAMTSDDASANSLSTFRQAMLGDEQLAAFLRSVWRSERGRECARQIAFREAAFHGMVRLPLQLAIVEYLAEHAFAGRLDQDEETVLTELAKKLIEHYAELGTPTAVADAAIGALAWKGRAGDFGWTDLAKRLEESPPVRGRLAYVLARRYVHLGLARDAKLLLQTALADSSEGEPLRRLAERDLKALSKSS